MSSDVLQYIVNPRCFISSSCYSRQLSLHVLIILPIYHEDHSNLYYRCRRHLSSFDVHERSFVHSASFSITQHYHIQISHLFIDRVTSSSLKIMKFRRRSASALIYLTQRLLCHLSRDLLRRSERQNRNSFNHQHDVAFL